MAFFKRNRKRKVEARSAPLPWQAPTDFLSAAILPPVWRDDTPSHRADPAPAQESYTSHDSGSSYNDSGGSSDSGGSGVSGGGCD